MAANNYSVYQPNIVFFRPFSYGSTRVGLALKAVLYFSCETYLSAQISAVTLRGSSMQQLIFSNSSYSNCTHFGRCNAIFWLELTWFWAYQKCIFILSNKNACAGLKTAVECIVDRCVMVDELQVDEHTETAKEVPIDMDCNPHVVRIAAMLQCKLSDRQKGGYPWPFLGILIATLISFTSSKENITWWHFQLRECGSQWWFAVAWTPRCSSWGGWSKSS